MGCFITKVRSAGGWMRGFLHRARVREDWRTKKGNFWNVAMALNTHSGRQLVKLFSDEWHKLRVRRREVGS